MRLYEGEGNFILFFCAKNVQVCPILFTQLYEYASMPLEKDIRDYA